MNYYIIYLYNGKILDITSWDEEAARNRQFENDLKQMADWGGILKLGDVYVNEVQTLDQVR